MIDQKLVSLRNITEADIPLLLNYWFHSPSGFIEGMGVDFKKMPTESEMKQTYLNRLAEMKINSEIKPAGVIITYDGKAIGMHSVVPFVEGDYGIFHAHIFNPDFRRKGLGMISYPKGCRLFMERFNLNKIIFKTPVQNTAAIRVKEN